MKRIGLLGCGRIGRIHAHNVVATPNAQLVAVCDPIDDAAQALAQATGAEVRRMADIIRADDIDAILLCTPTTTHYDIIHQAAERGKAVFCEKPVDLSLKRSQECVQAVAGAAIPFMVAFNRRFDPNFAALEKRLRQGDIGDIEMITILSRDPSPPPLEILKNSGGLFQDMMIHDFDMARFLLGEDPVEVYAMGSALVTPEIQEFQDIDTAAVLLKTASGKICQISNSRRASYGYDQRIEVHGSKGMVRADNQLETSVEIATEEGFQKAPAQHFFLERYAEAYRQEMAHFVENLYEGTAMAPNGQDGIAAQKLAEAALMSHKTGKPVALE